MNEQQRLLIFHAGLLWAGENAEVLYARVVQSMNRPLSKDESKIAGLAAGYAYMLLKEKEKENVQT